ncbi:MAG TPA: hypothetical protein VLH15_08720 [Dehalococcoidales bacterium]|nr:hypothetical protein [Dehalococcoidales bacterium]
MNVLDWKTQIRKKDHAVADLAQSVTEDPGLVSELLAELKVPSAPVKYKALKIITFLSLYHPALLNPHFDLFASMLDSPNNIFKWNAIDILANLTAVDGGHKFDLLFQKYYDLLKEGSLITAGHVVDSSPVIVKNRPEWEPAVTSALLSADCVPLPTPECRSILCGKVMKSFKQYFSSSSMRAEMREFARQRLNDSRPATAEKARQLLKLLG